MNDPAVAAELALAHFRLAALLTLPFVAACLAYLAAFWEPLRMRSPVSAFLLHTLFLLWQSNVAFFAVVALASGARLLEPAAPYLDGWRWAPFMVPSAAFLYPAILLLCIGVAWRRRHES
jgi:hypothetical protein